MAYIKYTYLKQRKDFGKQPLFSIQGPELCDSIAPEKADQKNFVLRNPVHQEIQNTKLYKEQYINTYTAEYTSTGVNHAEGGWPRDVVVTDPESTQRYRRKIEKEENYIDSVLGVSPNIEYFLLQNNSMDMYQTYFSEMEEFPCREIIGARTVNEYKSPSSSKRDTITSIAWESEEGRRFGVSHGNIDILRNVSGPVYSYIWDIERSDTPEFTFDPSCPIMDMKFGIKDHNLVIAGLLNGQISFWDRRRGSNAVGASEPHMSHRDLVKSVVFTMSKTGSEFMSAGPDGVCKWWDLRKIAEPVEEIILHVVHNALEHPSMEFSHGVSILEFEPTIPTRFMVGTEDGLVLNGNRKGKMHYDKLPITYKIQNGPIFSLQRNPAFLKNFLTVGDFDLKVWSEECREAPILRTPNQRIKLTCGAWSPSRISLVAVTQADGKIVFWDFLRKAHTPVLSMQICDEPLIKMAYHDNSTNIAVGNSKGNVYLVEVADSLALSDPNDKSIMSHYIERETKRERLLEAKVREIKLKQKQGEERSPTHSETGLIMSDLELREVTAEYMAIVKKEMANLGKGY